MALFGDRAQGCWCTGAVIRTALRLQHKLRRATGDRDSHYAGWCGSARALLGLAVENPGIIRAGTRGEDVLRGCDHRLSRVFAGGLLEDSPWPIAV